MITFTIARRLAPLAVLLALGAVGCAGATQSAAPAPVAVPVLPAPPVVPSLLGEGSVAQFCATQLAVGREPSSQNRPEFSSPGYMPFMVNVWARISAAGPKELKPDAEVLADAARRIQSGTLDLGSPGEQATSERVGDALWHLGEYSIDHCGGRSGS